MPRSQRGKALEKKTKVERTVNSMGHVQHSAMTCFTFQQRAASNSCRPEHDYFKSRFDLREEDMKRENRDLRFYFTPHAPPTRTPKLRTPPYPYLKNT